jgi:hypothetical protein
MDGAKRVTCRAHDPVSIGIDNINGWMGQKKSKSDSLGAKIYALIVWGPSGENVIV